MNHVTTWLMSAALLGLIACDSNDGATAPDSASVDSSSATCGTAGTASVTGTVGGETVSPVMAAFLSPTPTGYALVVHEDAVVCEPGADRAGQRLVLAFCDEVSAGQYTVLSEQDFSWDAACPGQRVAGAVLEDTSGGGDIEDGASGTITIDGTDDCLDGSFAVTFTDGNALSGSFSAVRCAP
jgi:hypothetical protein